MANLQFVSPPLEGSGEAFPSPLGEVRRLLSLLVLLLMMSLTMVGQNADAPLRIGVSGVAHGHLWNLVSQMHRGDFVIVGVAEENEELRAHNSLVGRLPKEKFYASLAKMIEREQPEVVVDYGSILHHMSTVETCAKRGVHVMVEKPLATTYKQALRMEELAKRYGIKIMTNYETTWYPAGHRVRQLAAGGQLGDITRIEVYDGHEGPREIGCDRMFLSWLTDPKENGGGAVIDFGCYGVNLATWLLDGQVPQSVYAVLQHKKPWEYPLVDDDATIILQYEGCTVQVMGSWCWPYSRKDMYVYGSRGYAYQRTASQMQVLIDGRRSREFSAPALQAPLNDSYRYLKALVRGEIEEHPSDPSALENNVLVVRILEAAIRSAGTGKAVKL